MNYNRPDAVVINKEKNRWYIVAFAISMDYHVKNKEEEDIDKYMDLEAEVRRQFSYCYCCCGLNLKITKLLKDRSDI